MTITSIVRKAAITLAAVAPLYAVTGLTTANAAGYYVEANALTANFPGWDRLNIRAWPAAHSRKVAQVRVGRTVYVERCIIKSGTDWCKIRKNWKYGWVNGSFIKKGGYTFAHPHPIAHSWH